MFNRKKNLVNTHQTKQKEKIRNLSEKDFRIMIVKMIQNLESKMKLQINIIKKRIEKM